MMRPTPRTCLALGLAALAACGPEKPATGSAAQAIIDGKSCNRYTHPAAVALIMDAQVRHKSEPTTGSKYPMRSVICSGTLIAPDTVLTAAHCIGLSEMLHPDYRVSDESYRAWIDATMKAGCKSGGRRGWCDVAGIPAPDTEFGDGGGCAVAGGDPRGLALLLLALACWLMAQRRRTAAAACAGRRWRR